MTAAGMDVDNLDLTSDPAGAVTAIDAALSEAVDYTEHLSIKADMLESADVTLQLQSKALLATNSAIESADAALMVIGMLGNNSMVQTQVFVAAQANSTAETVLKLLAD